MRVSTFNVVDTLSVSQAAGYEAMQKRKQGNVRARDLLDMATGRLNRGGYDIVTDEDRRRREMSNEAWYVVHLHSGTPMRQGDLAALIEWESRVFACPASMVGSNKVLCTFIVPSQNENNYSKINSDLLNGDWESLFLIVHLGYSYVTLDGNDVSFLTNKPHGLVTTRYSPYAHAIVIEKDEDDDLDCLAWPVTPDGKVFATVDLQVLRDDLAPHTGNYPTLRATAIAPQMAMPKCLVVRDPVVADTALASNGKRALQIAFQRSPDAIERLDGLSILYLNRDMVHYENGPRMRTHTIQNLYWFEVLPTTKRIQEGDLVAVVRYKGRLAITLPENVNYDDVVFYTLVASQNENYYGNMLSMEFVQNYDARLLILSIDPCVVRPMDDSADFQTALRVVLAKCTPTMGVPVGVTMGTLVQGFGHEVLTWAASPKGVQVTKGWLKAKAV